MKTPRQQPTKPRVKYLDPKADIVFKRIFGEHASILKSLLNALLPLAPDGQIVSIEYLTPEQVPEIPEFKDTVVDVRCKDAKGRKFIVEMQMAWTDSFKNRMLFNSCKAIVTQLEKGSHYSTLQPVYALAILDATFDDSASYYHHYQIISEQSSNRVLEGLEMVFVELPKYDSKQTQSVKEAWLWFLKEAGKNTAAPAIIANTPEIAKALQLAEESAYNPAQLEMYDRYWDHVSRERTMKEESFAKGELKGKAEGKAEGKNEALELMIASGIPEDKARRILKL